ncbi:MAG: periplasmic heavy metal sensor [Desulfovibrio sp.]|nr:periplasmic heavy metal sensor [Desulfovibrio sp.]
MQTPLKKGLVALAFLLTLSLAHTQSHAHPAGQGPCMQNAPCTGQAPCPGVEGAMLQSITPEQRAQYYAISKEFEPKLRELNDQLFIKKNELEALKHAVQPDVNAVRSTAQEIVKLRNEKRAVQQAKDERIAKECGITRPARPIPGVDVPFHRGQGPRHFGPRGPHGGFGPEGHHGPHGYPGPHGPMPQ